MQVQRFDADGDSGSRPRGRRELGTWWRWRAGLATGLAAVLSVGTADHGSAAPPVTVTVNGTATATSSAGTSIVIGDSFDWTITFDLDAISTGSTPSFGNTFNDSVVAFGLQRDPGNVGTWDPTGITWPVAPASNVAANANSEGITVQQVPGAGPAIDGVAFRDVSVSFSWNSADLDAVWVAGPTDLRTWLGTSTPDFTSAVFSFELRDTNFNSPSFTVSGPTPPATVPSSIPPPPPPTTTTTTTTPPTTTTTIIPTTTTEVALVPETVIVTERGVTTITGEDFEVRLDTAESGVLVVDAGGFRAGSSVEMWLFSKPTYLGGFTVGADGSVRERVTVPPDLSGSHTLRIEATLAGGQPVEFEIPVDLEVSEPLDPSVLPDTGGEITVLGLVAVLLLAIGMVGVTRRRRLPG